MHIKEALIRVKEYLDHHFDTLPLDGEREAIEALYHYIKHSTNYFKDMNSRKIGGTVITPIEPKPQVQKVNICSIGDGVGCEYNAWGNCIWCGKESKAPIKKGSEPFQTPIPYFKD